MLFLGSLWIISGNTVTLLTMMFAVLLHEAAHCLSAKIFGLETTEITLYLFGGLAEIKGIDEDCVKEGIIAFSGPLISVFTGFLWQIGAEKSVLPFWQEFIDYSYAIALINLLPVYPLDGGRILLCLFKSMFGIKKGEKLTKFIGVSVSVLFLTKNIISLILWGKAQGLVMAVFMVIASLKTIKKPKNVYMREKSWQNIENIKIIKAYENESLLTVSKKLFGTNFYIILVFNEYHDVVGMLTEKQINEKLFFNSAFTLKEAIKNQNSQVP